MDADESFPLFVMINVFSITRLIFGFFFLRILWQLNSQYTICYIGSNLFFIDIVGQVK